MKFFNGKSKNTSASGTTTQSATPHLEPHAHDDKTHFSQFEVLCGSGSLKTVKKYVKENLKDNQTINIWNDGLLEACINDRTDTVMYLLNHGAMLEYKTSEGCHALLELCIRKHFECVANIFNSKDLRPMAIKMSLDTLMNCAKWDDSTTESMMINQVIVSPTEVIELLNVLVTRGKTESACIIISKWFNVIEVWAEPVDAFITAIKQNNTKLVCAFINAGIKVNTMYTDDGYETTYYAIMTACDGENDTIVDLIMKANADIELTYSRKCNLLHHLAQMGNIKYLKYFVNKFPSNFDMENFNAETPLHSAINGGSVACFQFLLTHYCDLEFANKYGKSMYNLGNMLKSTKMCMMLVEYLTRLAEVRIIHSNNPITITDINSVFDFIKDVCDSTKEKTAYNTNRIVANVETYETHRPDTNEHSGPMSPCIEPSN